MISTTLRRILEAEPCYDPRSRGLLPADHDLDAPISFSAIVEKAGLADALWCCKSAPEHDALWRHFAVDCAERVQHLMTDERIRNALVVARRFAQGQATQAELADARKTALYAARADARSAARAALDAALAARAAMAALAALDARAAMDAALADQDSALYAARDAALAAMAAERAWQAARLIDLTEAGEWSPVKPFG